MPNSATLHNARSFLEQNRPFQIDGEEAVLEFDPRWVHVEPMALAMAAAWGAWARRMGMQIRVENFGQQTAYVARMRLFQHLGIAYEPRFVEREETGRFLPLTQVKTANQVSSVIGSISDLLHLQDWQCALA